MQNPSSRPAYRWPVHFKSVKAGLPFLRDASGASRSIGLMMLTIVLILWVSTVVILRTSSVTMLSALLSANLLIGIVTCWVLAYYSTTKRSPTSRIPATPAPHLMSSSQTLQNISVMFVDMSNFCELVQYLQPAQQMALLHEIYSNFDRIIISHGLHRIKTNGDEYIAATTSNELHFPTLKDQGNSTVAISMAAKDIRQYFNQMTRRHAHICRLRIGIATGDVITGSIGILSPCTDMWGKPMLVASRLEGNCTPDQILLCSTTYERVKSSLDTNPVGNLNLKGLGTTKAYRLVTS
ncbi:adenylate/guanylate cyclase domain-containing protein [Alteromonas facilis]|uniref:adenylate/guanylate cyclase domain-containing protein n=1 Tax=Alteromonas facilis TaxID=2048004 RepID=UPI000C28852B|nr:adenylate/guanylate cyclase domain-containing protein [Alteromonas facilis]